MSVDQIICGDCLEEMPKIPTGSIDMILCDLPYGITACKWDQVILFEPLWKEYKRLIKEHGAIVLTASQPFTSALVMSNPGMFRYEWIYEKTNPKGFLSANYRPLTSHENVLVFSRGTPRYFPQKWQIPEYLRTKRKHATSHTSGECYGARSIIRWDDDGSRFPQSVIGFSNRVDRENNFHPTQKPVELFEYLIKTYTNPGELVLDNCIGSGTTAVACRNSDRHFIGIEKDSKYVDVARQRIAAVPARLDRWASKEVA